MAMTHEQLQQSAREHLLMHFTRHQAAFANELLVLDRGEGPYVFDTRGQRYIDALSSLFCCQIGYSYGEEMLSAIADQVPRLAFNTNWGTTHPPRQGRVQQALRQARARQAAGRVPVGPADAGRFMDVVGKPATVA